MLSEEKYIKVDYKKTFSLYDIHFSHYDFSNILDFEKRPCFLVYVGGYDSLFLFQEFLTYFPSLQS